MRNPHASEISDQIRENVRSDLSPMLGEIGNPEMREWVVEAWATALWLNGFTAVSQLQGSANVDMMVEIGATQADHLCGVARTAKAIAQAWLVKDPAYPIDLDLVVAGGLLHDVGKPNEYNPENRKKWKENLYKEGFPTASHAIYGFHILMLLGLPMEVCCIPAMHAREGGFWQRSLVTTIIHFADYQYWDCLKLLGKIDPLTIPK